MPVNYRKLIIFILFASMSFVVIPQYALHAQELVDLQKLIRQVEQQYNGDSSHVTATMQIVTSRWERSITLEGWSLGREFCLTRILAPAKERGVSTLKVKRQVWNYLPKIDRVIKIPPSMMGAPWMGSHITNDDLVKSSHVDLDYDLKLVEDTPEFRRVACTPRPEAAVVWGKIVYTILKPHNVPLKVEYFDDAMVRVRTISFDDVQSVGDHLLPLRMTVQPQDSPGEHTTLQYDDIVFDIPVEETFFSLQRLKAK